MTWKNTNLKRIIALSFGIILIISFLIAVVIHFETKRLWNYTHELYIHPFQENRSVNNVRNIIVSIDQSLRKINLHDSLSTEKLTLALEEINKKERDGYLLFDIAYNTYTGPQIKIDSAFYLFKNWKLLRDELIKSIKNGSGNSYFQLLQENEAYLLTMLRPIDQMVRFNRNKADEFYIRAQEGMFSFVNHLWILYSFLVLSTIIVVYFLVRSIRDPLQDLTRIANQYRSGKYDVRSEYTSDNEIGVLASAFNNLAASVQEELLIKNEISGISSVLLGENDIKLFCQKLLDNLIAVTKSDAGAVYFMNEDKIHFNLFEARGLMIKWDKSLPSENIQIKNLVEKKIVVHAKKSAVLPGLPVLDNKEWIIIPLLENEGIISIIILSSEKAYSAFAVKFIREIRFRINSMHLRIMKSEELIRTNAELKIAKDNAESADKMKSSFLSTMSHELRTPLNSVIGFSTILLKQLPGPLNEEQIKQLTMIQNSGTLLLSLINDILDISKIESGELNLLYSEFDPQDVIEEIIKMISPIASSKNISINFTRTENIGIVKSDRLRVHQVLLNIVNNAVKFTEKGSINIKCFKADEHLNVEVADTGIGIKPENIEKIFNPFVQLDNNLTRKYPGSGLGLSISKKLVKMLNGEITVYAEYGSGSVFTVKLPLTI